MSQSSNLPEIITFTGVDEYTDPAQMQTLARRYPGRIEWGILFSPGRQGSDEHPRYPRLRFIEELVTELDDVRLAAHLCGEDARCILDTGESPHEELLGAYFERAQINAGEPDVAMVARWARRAAVHPVVQCRGDFPRDDRVQFLFDASGGRGVRPGSWPAGRDVLCGYAGGINPANAAESVAQIGRVAGRYWIDMESGVRDERDRFSLRMCQAVCEAVYGVSGA